MRKWRAWRGQLVEFSQSFEALQWQLFGRTAHKTCARATEIQILTDTHTKRYRYTHARMRAQIQESQKRTHSSRRGGAK